MAQRQTDVIEESIFPEDEMQNTEVEVSSFEKKKMWVVEVGGRSVVVNNDRPFYLAVVCLGCFGRGGMQTTRVRFRDISQGIPVAG